MSGRKRNAATRRTLPALILPLIILVGIKTGLFTKAVAVAHALLIGVICRDLTMRGVWEALIATTLVSAPILFIIAMASIVSFVLTLEQVPTHIAEATLSITRNPWVSLLLPGALL